MEKQGGGNKQERWNREGGGKPISAWQVSAAVFGAQMLELLSTNEAAECELD